MPLSQWRYVSVQKYQWYNCHRNPFSELTLIYGSHNASLDIRNVSRTVQWFSGAPECRLSLTKLQTQSNRWRIPFWTASVHSRWCHKSLSPAGEWHAPYQPSSSSWLQSQHRIGGSVIAVTCRRSCLPPAKPCLWQQFSLGQVVWRICFWDRLPWSGLPAIVVAHDVGIIYRKVCV